MTKTITIVAVTALASATGTALVASGPANGGSNDSMYLRQIRDNTRAVQGIKDEIHKLRRDQARFCDAIAETRAYCPSVLDR